VSEQSLTQKRSFRVADYLVDPARLRVTNGGEEARLEAKVMLVLVYLAEHAGDVVSRTELEEKLWPGRIVTEDSVTKAIAKLRRVFADDARHPEVIETVPKSGYRLIAAVTPINEAVEKGAIGLGKTTKEEQRSLRLRLPWVLGSILVLALLIGALALFEQDRKPSVSTVPVSHKPAVAVVPFKNLGVAPQEDYFANGITADLITDLSKVNGLLVIAPGTVFAYRDSDRAPRQISAELDVDYLIVGSVQRLVDSLRINVQLIDANAERAIWGERYTGVLNDIFDIQDELVATVIAALKVELDPVEQAYLANRPTGSIDAYDHYLRGLAEHGGRSEAQNLSARGYFEKAIELDPAFARAYTGLALTYSREAIDGWTSMPSESLERASRLAAKATRIDSALPQAHFVGGQVKLFQRRHAQAIASAERALEVDPNYADAYALLAWTLNYAGQSDQALTALERAIRLNPKPPASYLEILGEIHFAQGEYQESASTFRRVLGINPGYLRARMWYAAAIAQAESEDEAQWEVAELLVASPLLTLSRLEFAFPFQNHRILETVMNSLRKAGLPAK
jgi:TolB-like protein/DNA-binding winged helix-turn-helix (wHTH) protein/Tfp pilus assembly protein PilF